ncbi:MAG: aldo/keto reductase [Bilophila sp.]|nr:aldo/keto reductase [Bilophila sp.]
MQTTTLRNGIEMPLAGFGVFQVPDATLCEQAVSEALVAGYRLIDTASVYRNEEAVGAAVRKSGIPRKELFITTKVWIQEAGYEKTKEAFEASLNRLGLDILDLYLIHMPFGDYYGSWRAMEELYEDGRIRAIGVCNFLPDRLMDLCRNASIPPMLNQVEMHPFCQQKEALEIMRECGVQPQAWAPFAEGMRGIFRNRLLCAIGQKYGKTAAQVMLRWNIQRGVAVIPKSVHRERIEENARIWDFTLDDQDMEAIAHMDEGHGLILDTLAPSEVKRLYGI